MKQKTMRLPKVTVKTKSNQSLIDINSAIGDKLTNQWYESNDLRVIQTALSAYKNSISSGKLQLVYKKLTNSKKRISFFE